MIVNWLPINSVAAFAVSVAIASLACASMDSRPFPTDSQLAQRITQHPDLFERIITMAHADTQLVRIAPDFTWTTRDVAWPRPDSQLGLSRERWTEYRRLFQALGLEAGLLQRPEDEPRVTYLLVQTKGLVTNGSAKGYAYSDGPLQPRCTSLDRIPLGNDTRICYKPLWHNWYIYLEWD